MNTKIDEHHLIQEIWNWRTCAQGKISSVSAAFSVCFGVHANKQIIGHTFWHFADGLDKPLNGWAALATSFHEKTAIKKFVFSYHYKNKSLKIALSGNPIYDKGKYIGHSGTGYFVDDNEITTPEINQNMLNISIDTLDVGIAIFCPSTGLIEFNDNFMKQMTLSGVRLKHNMTYETLIAFLKARNKFIPEISSVDDEVVDLFFQKQNATIINLKKSENHHNLMIVKTEINKNIYNKFHHLKNNTQHLFDSNKILEKRMEEYKVKLTHLINDKKENHKETDESLKKIINFYENNLDIGIIITSCNSQIETTNYVAAQMFGYRTPTSLIIDGNTQTETEFNNFLLQRAERITDLIERQENRFEDTIALNNFSYKGTVKNVITFYPSVHNPIKVISFLYPQEQQDNNNTNDKENNNLDIMHEQFIRYMVEDIKTSVNVISGYNELRKYIKDDNKLLDNEKKVSDSCSNILDSIYDVMQAYKVTANNQNLEQTVYSFEAQLTATLEDINHKTMHRKINLAFDVIGSHLWIVTDKMLLQNSLNKIFSCILMSAKANSSLQVQLKTDFENRKISLLISDESLIDLSILYHTDIHQIFDNPNIRTKSALELKIAQIYLQLLGFELKVKYFENNGNHIIIEIPSENLVTDFERDDDVFAI